MTTIRRRLLWTVLPAMAALLCAGSAAIYIAIHDALLESNDATLRSKLTAIAAVVHADGDGVRIDASSRVLRDFEAPDSPDANSERHEEGEHDDGDAFFEIWGNAGTVLARSPSLQGADLPFTTMSGEADERPGWTIALPSGHPGRALGIRFRPRPLDGTADTRTAPVSLIVAMDRRELDGTLQTVAVILGGAGGAMLLALGIVVPAIVRRGLAPLDVVAAQAAGITATSLSTRFAVDRLPGELVPISGRLNDLLARLEGSFERERQFSSDLAHELRTPIAELRSLAEVALKWPDVRPADTDREALAIARQLDGIVSRLLTLLRSERGHLLVDRQPMDLETEVQHVCDAFVARATGRGLQLTSDVAPGLRAETDAVLVRSILTNLLENAVEYAPQGSAVRVTAATDGERCVVSVSNPACDLRDGDLPKLFDRFWRRSASRSDGEHSGLGLSIAREFATAIGGDLTASLTEGHVMFTLALTSPAGI